jgi:hypothetical protein
MLVVVALAAIVVAAPPASAKATVVRGIQTPVDSGPCFSASAAFSTTMEGGLLGCWWIDTITPDPSDPASYHPSGTVRFSGTEHFTGCLNSDGDAVCDPGEPFGTFYTTYTFTAKFDADGNEIHGRCHHPIVMGSDGFDGVSGVINFTDDVTTSPPTSPYWGPVTL